MINLSKEKEISSRISARSARRRASNGDYIRLALARRSAELNFGKEESTVTHALDDEERNFLISVPRHH